MQPTIFTVSHLNKKSGFLLLLILVAGEESTLHAQKMSNTIFPVQIKLNLFATLLIVFLAA